jgi:hypothetical protein
MRLGDEAVGLMGELEPAVNGTRFDADDARDILYFVARLNCLNGLAPAPATCGLPPGAILEGGLTGRAAGANVSGGGRNGQAALLVGAGLHG